MALPSACDARHKQLIVNAVANESRSVGLVTIRQAGRTMRREADSSKQATDIVRCPDARCRCDFKRVLELMTDQRQNLNTRRSMRVEHDSEVACPGCHRD